MALPFLSLGLQHCVGGLPLHATPGESTRTQGGFYNLNSPGLLLQLCCSGYFFKGQDLHVYFDWSFFS